MEDIESSDYQDHGVLIRCDTAAGLTYELYSTAECGVTIYSVRIFSERSCASFHDISRDPSRAESLYSMLLEGEVTPLTLAEILEDIMETY